MEIKQDQKVSETWSLPNIRKFKLAEKSDFFLKISLQKTEKHPTPPFLQIEFHKFEMQNQSLTKIKSEIPYMVMSLLHYNSFATIAHSVFLDLCELSEIPNPLIFYE